MNRVRTLLLVIAALLSGCAGFYIDPSVMGSAYRVEPEVVRDKVAIVWHRVTNDQLARLSHTFLPSQVAALGGMALPGPDGECHIFSPDVRRDPSWEARILAHEVMHCFFGGYHTLEAEKLVTGTTWQGLSSPQIASHYLALALAAVNGEQAPEPALMPEQADSGCGE